MILPIFLQEFPPLPSLESRQAAVPEGTSSHGFAAGVASRWRRDGEPMGTRYNQ